MIQDAKGDKGIKKALEEQQYSKDKQETEIRDNRDKGLMLDEYDSINDKDFMDSMLQRNKNVEDMSLKKRENLRAKYFYSHMMAGYFVDTISNAMGVGSGVG